MINIIKVENKQQVETVAQLAIEIWQQHFTPIIGAEQVSYMLDKFQSTRAITAQIADGWEYYIAILDDRYAGYTGIVPEHQDSKMLLSKIYVKSSIRGNGVGNKLLYFVEETSRARGFNSLWLTVNRFNDDTVAWYVNHGFATVDEVRKDIGSGFFMDDFIMEKLIE